jgi:hypothetical protein
MARPAETGARAHRSSPVPTVPSALLAAACGAAGPGGFLGSAARLLAPQLRGRVSSRTLATLELKGLRVHRVGQAAYVHGQGAHWILAVWDRGEPLPPFAARLGRVSDGYRRRCERLARETRHLEMARVRGRFAGRLPWQRVRPVRAYRWDPEPRSWLELVTERAAGHNHLVRLAAGLEWADNRVATWYPEAGSALEARGMDGDR